jgi:hypothetical protein
MQISRFGGWLDPSKALARVEDGEPGLPLASGLAKYCPMGNIVSTDKDRLPGRGRRQGINIMKQ